MATYPLAHSSSPAVVKATSTSATISTAAFDPPARVAIVVGVTSDADTNAGAVPTLTAITGLTWTRVGPALGFSATGDVGVVALFQGVLDNPNTDLGSITVTANVGITASKPKMLVVRVYDETQVDIADPIGAFTSGSFATSTSFLGTVTPETSEGGLRGLWLDWAATGVPTTFLPNNDNAELVDSFHNAGLSTNGQISRENRTVAGVPQSLGVNMLAASSDGNWLVYELRGPQPAAGSAIDSTAFDTASFDTGGGSVGTDFPLGGTVAATSTAAGAPTLRMALVGAVAATTALAGSIGVAQGLGGTVPATSTASGAITANHPLGGTIAATTTTTGAATANHPLAGSSAATSTVTGSPGTQQSLAGTVAATTAASGAITLRAPLAGAVAATSTTSGAATSRQGIAGTVNAVSSTAGTFFEAGPQVYPLAGNVTATTTTTGSITARHPLSGTVAAASTAVGAIARAASLAGTVTGTTVVLGGVTASVTLSGEVTATSSTAGTFVGADLPDVELTVGTMQPARFSAGPALPAPTATAEAPRITAGTPLPPRYTRRT